MADRKIPVMRVLILALCLGVCSGGGWASQEEGGIGRLEVLLCNPLLEQLEMTSTWEAAKAVGVKAIEVHVEPDLTCSKMFVGTSTPYKLDSPENASKLRMDGLENGIAIPVIVAPIQLDPGAALESGAPDWALQLIDMAPYVGAEVIYFPIVTDNFTKVTYDDEKFIEGAVFVLNDLVARGERRGVTVALENLSVYWNRPEILRKVLAEFGEDELGLCLDPINFYWYGHPISKVHEIAAEFIPRAAHFHVKNVAHPADKKEVQREPGWQYGENSVPAADGDVDFEKLIGLLINSDYNGYISIEDDSLEHFPVAERVQILKRDVEYVQRITQGFLGGVQ